MNASGSSTRLERKALAARLQPFVDYARTFSGWEFSGIDERVIGDGLPWDYEQLASEQAAHARRVLDLGTGGGEVLSRIATGRAISFVATEQWHVNAPVARDRLASLGIPVIRAKSDGRCLPFRDSCFELVLSRHEAVEPAEVDRVLARGGTFLTQQVAPDNWPELTAYFPRKTIFPDHFNGYVEAFRRLGYAVTRRWHELHVAYATLGDLVAMLLIAKDYVPDLDIERDADALLDIERELATAEGIQVSSGRYLLEARKPG